MTTIAVNKTMMAGDRQFTYNGNLRMLGKSKIFEIPDTSARALFNCDRAFVGLCGAAGQFATILSYLWEPTNKPPKVKGIELVLLNNKGEIYHAETLSDWLQIHDPYFAIGSGMQFAIAAMSCGKDPYEAVKIAGKHDPMTGLKYNKLEMKE